MRKARLLAATTALLLLLAAPASRAADALVLFADRDDDDADGVPDAEQTFVPPSPELVPIPRPTVIPPGSTFARRGQSVRVLVDDRPLAPGDAIPPRPRRL